MQDKELKLENADGDSYIGTLTGAKLFDDGEYAVYSLDDGRLIGYDADKLAYYEIKDEEEELRGFVRDDADYVRLMRKLGLTPRVAI